MLLCFLTLTIPSAGAQQATFYLAAPNEITIRTRSGQHQVFDIAIVPANGFSGTVHIEFSNVPQGISIGGPGVDIPVPAPPISYVMSAGFGAVLGTYTITTTGTFGPIVSTRPTVIHVVLDAQCNSIQFPQECTEATSTKPPTQTTIVIDQSIWVALFVVVAIVAIVVMAVIILVFIKGKRKPAVISSVRYCSKCGANLPSDSRFCKQCGTQL